MIDYKIDFNDMITVYNDPRKISAMRVFYQEPEEKDGWPELKMKIVKGEFKESECKKLSVDITKDILESMCNVAEYKEEIIKDQLIHQIIRCSSKIAVSSRRGPGNFVVFSENIYEDFEKRFGQYIVDGMINSTLKIMVLPHINDKIIVGYRGNVEGDCGIVLYSDGNRYQLIDIPGSGKFYAVLEEK